MGIQLFSLCTTTSIFFFLSFFFLASLWPVTGSRRRFELVQVWWVKRHVRPPPATSSPGKEGGMELELGPVCFKHSPACCSTSFHHFQPSEKIHPGWRFILDDGCFFSPCSGTFSSMGNRAAREQRFCCYAIRS